MACPWRIRHKLMLGLGLVVAIMALLLLGTLKALLSYIDTTKTLDSKLAELQCASALKESVKTLAAIPPHSSEEQKRSHVRDQAEVARKALATYRSQLDDTLHRHRDPDKGVLELGYLEKLDEQFSAVKKALETIPPLADTVAAGSEDELRPELKAPVNLLIQTADDLLDAINKDMGTRIMLAKSHYKTSLWMVIATCVTGMVLLTGSLRSFYNWVFQPIRDLQRGAGYVAQGDFGHRIEVHSGDEMEELAAAFNDMTSRLNDMYKDLARQVNERSRQLVRSERLASVGFLAAGVAHEINNPLASIAFCSEALEARLGQLLDPTNDPRPADVATVTRYLKMIQEEAFRCKKITERLLDFSRGGDRKRERTDLAELIQSVVDVSQLVPQCKGKTIVFEPSRSSSVSAWVNADEVKSVVLNLVMNALDSMDDGGTLTIALGQRDGRAEVSFTDTGCGMTAEVLENIFEPFFTRSRSGKGTGLGLTITHLIINQHGGEIEAASPGPDQGSTFTVRLPVQPPVEATEEEARRAA